MSAPVNNLVLLTGDIDDKVYTVINAPVNSLFLLTGALMIRCILSSMHLLTVCYC